MNDGSQSLPVPVGPPRTRWRRLARKELRETLRDRRTLVTLLLMPVLVYPLLSITFNRFLVTMSPGKQKQMVIAVEPESAMPLVQRVLEKGSHNLLELSAQDEKKSDSDHQAMAPALWAVTDAQSAVDEVQVAAGIKVLSEDKFDPTGTQPLRLQLIYREGEPLSGEALRFIEQRIYAYNAGYWRQQLARAGRSQSPAITAVHHATKRGHSTSLSLAMILPLILILMTITGAVYPAIDLTAGERERGTLEMLIAAPVPRFQLLTAKYAAVLTVALLTAMVNLVSMVVTLSLSGLGSVLFGDAGPSFWGLLLVAGLTVLFAAFFSAVLLAITSVARSFKEAQAYLIPVMLLAISPGVLSLMPQIKLNGWMAFIPLVNAVLLSRDALSGTAHWTWTLAVLGSTTVYGVIAILIAARIFGTDAFSTNTSAQWRDLVRRPEKARLLPASAHGPAILASAFICYYFLGHLVTRFAGYSIANQILGNSMVTLLVFGGIPCGLSYIRRIDFKTTFRLNAPNPFAVGGALLLGISLWPWAYQLFRLSEKIGLTSVEQSTLDRMEKLLQGLESVPLVWIILALGIIPAVAEEWFFRGFILSWLRARSKPVTAVIGSALLFGVFHVVSPAMATPERFLPTALLGICLGWVCYKTGSLFPGIILHATHNSLLLLMVTNRESMTWFWGDMKSETTPSVPIVYSVLSVVIVLIGIGLIAFKRRGKDL